MEKRYPTRKPDGSLKTIDELVAEVNADVRSHIEQSPAHDWQRTTAHSGGLTCTRCRGWHSFLKGPAPERGCTG